MPDRVIHPVQPVSRSGKVVENKKHTDNKKKSDDKDKKKDTVSRRKGIIDTYA